MCMGKAAATCRVLVEETAREDFICVDLRTQFVNLDIALRAGTVRCEQLNDFCTRMNSFRDAASGRPRGAIWEFLLDHPIGRSIVAFAEESFAGRIEESKIDKELDALASKITMWTDDRALPLASEVGEFFEQVAKYRQDKKVAEAVTKAQQERLANIESEYRRTAIIELRLFMKVGANTALEMAAYAHDSGGLMAEQRVSSSTGCAGNAAEDGAAPVTVLDLDALQAELFDADFVCTFYAVEQLLPGISAEVKKFDALHKAVFPVLQFVLTRESHLASRMEPTEASLQDLETWASIDLSVFDQACCEEKWKEYYSCKFLPLVHEFLSSGMQEKGQRDITLVKRLVQECEAAAGHVVLCDNAAAARLKDRLIIVISCFPML